MTELLSFFKKSVNSEIYNHGAIRQQLFANGHKFRTGSDCEVIAHLVSQSTIHLTVRCLLLASNLSKNLTELMIITIQYKEHGEEFIDTLDGVFTFVLLDTHDGTFLAAPSWPHA
jgi:asparagine synthase (glutamine-hydrolysing)